MEVILLRSANSALGGYPIHGVFTDSKVAEAALDEFEQAEERHLKKRWKGDWKNFSSTFFLDTFTADIPAAELTSKMYDLT